MMICAWAGQPCHKPNCEHCVVRDRERNIRNIAPLHFVFCLECVKVMQCELAESDFVDGCWKGEAYEDLQM